MLRNYFKIAIRNLIKNKVHSFINIGGLAIGMAVALLIGLWIWDELSVNKQFKNYDRIARAQQNQVFDGEVKTSTSVPRQLGPELRNKYGSYFKQVVLATRVGKHTLTVGKTILRQSGNFMEPGAPDLLSLHMLKGSRNGLYDPSSIFLSATAAKAFFGDDDPVNKLMKLNNGLHVKVTGVYEDLPFNSSFGELQFIAPWDLMAKADKLDERKVGWGNNWFQLFVLLADNADPAQVSAIIKNAKANNLDVNDRAGKPEIFLYPMSRWHLYSEFKNGVPAGGRIDNVWLFGTIGVFVLLLACINFMNLSTARSVKRAKEVGIRKSVGSMRGQLIAQFFSESLFITVLAFLVSLSLIMLMLSWFNEVAGKQVSMPWTSAGFWLAGIGFSSITGLIAGAYPALYLSSFKPEKVLKGVFRAGPYAAIPRKVLVVLQFTISTVLIICTIVVFRQIQFGKERTLGFSKNNLVTVPLRAGIKEHFTAFSQSLVNSGAVTAITRVEASAVNAWTTNSGLDWNGKPPGMQDEFFTIATDHQFGKTFQWQLTAGKDFSTALATDSMGFILNETAVKYMGFKDPIGQRVKAFGTEYHVIGVTKDMVLQSPYEPVKPMIYYVDKYNRMWAMVMRLNENITASAALASIEKVYRQFDSENPFEYNFADEEYDAKFKAEERVGKLAAFFAVFAILISCLGLFGMASFMAEQRIREIGVRKVLGASVFNLWGLLSKDFVLLVIIALLLAIPVASYFMYNWLAHYEYHTSLSWWIFGITGLGALLITLLTVSYQAISAALTNPVKCLRTE